ncbi:helix-turn-helix domain protein [Actinobacteria bacterium OK074]|nr:helix-turn-helix domain protein [Actinobacteria bacterium OK074]
MPRTSNSRLRALLEAAGWSQTQLAHALRKVADEHGMPLACDHSTIRRWLAGTQPRPPASAYLLETLARRLGRPVTAQEAGLTQAPVTVIDPYGESDPLRRLALLTRSESDPTQRRLLGSNVFSVAALVAPVPDRHGRPSAHQARPTVGRRVGAPEVEQAQAMISAFSALSEQHGGGPVRASAAAYLAHHITPWLHAPATTTVHRQLMSKAAQLALLLGNMSVDSGIDALAQHYHRTAAQMAADAGDVSTLAVALRTMATHAHELGHHDVRVLNLAEQAADRARHCAHSVRAYTQAHLAVILAHHDRHAALTALARAEHLHARADSPSGPFSAYPGGALHYQRANTLATLGDLRGAINALTTSLRLRTGTEHHAAALTRARLAEAHLRLGHLDQALTHWGAFVDAYPTVQSARTIRVLTSMRQRLRPHRRHTAVTALLTHAGNLT